jgi:hypothetical protein
MMSEAKSSRVAESAGSDVKRPYAKPVCRRIRLTTDEVLAAGCKNDSSNGPQQSVCDDGLGSQCSQSGS